MTTEIFSPSNEVPGTQQAVFPVSLMFSEHICLFVCQLSLAGRTYTRNLSITTKLLLLDSLLPEVTAGPNIRVLFSIMIIATFPLIKTYLTYQYIIIFLIKNVIRMVHFLKDQSLII